MGFARYHFRSHVEIYTYRLLQTRVENHLYRCYNIMYRKNGARKWNESLCSYFPKRYYMYNIKNRYLDIIYLDTIILITLCSDKIIFVETINDTQVRIRLSTYPHRTKQIWNFYEIRHAWVIVKMNCVWKFVISSRILYFGVYILIKNIVSGQSVSLY